MAGFPFSDLTRAKRRPALVVAELEGDDLILCQITSQNVRDKYAIPLKDEDFATVMKIGSCCSGVEAENEPR